MSSASIPKDVSHDNRSNETTTRRKAAKAERRYRQVIRLSLAGELPNFMHQRHLHVANILHHLRYGREMMHLGLQVMAHRHFVPDKYSTEVTDRYSDQLDGTLPDPAVFDDLPDGACS